MANTYRARGPSTVDRGVSLQREYYARTAGAYDLYRENDSMVHYVSLRHIAFYLDWIGAKSVLDTGCGTGRAMRFLMDIRPDLQLRGNDPVQELLSEAERGGIPGELLECAGSDPLPYEDGAFDAVIAVALLHHVPEPGRVVAEMLRVARKAVFISDLNIYGAGSAPARATKLLLSRARLLKPFNWIRRGGRDWYYSEEDGVAYSYSVFDSLPLIRDSCAQTIVLPVDNSPRAPIMPILGSSVCFVGGFKKSLAEQA